MPTDDSPIYHERQHFQFCLLHALNNLFQRKDEFTRASLNEIADNLALSDTEKQKWNPMSLIFKPHHNSVTGNYDVNVLIAALEGKGKSVVWHDRRNPAAKIDLGGDALMGIVLNIPVKRYSGMWNSRHWVALREIDGIWYNLDSDLPGPKIFENTEKVREFLDAMIEIEGQVLLVLSREYA